MFTQAKSIVIWMIVKLEFIKIKLFGVALGSHYIVNSLRNCRKENIVNILNGYGANIGTNNHFKGNLHIDNANYLKKNIFSNLIIYNNCYIGKNIFLDLANQIILENDVVLSANVTIITHADVGDRKMNKYFKRFSKKVVCSEASWVGVSSTILAGVHLGEYSIIGASSLVTKDTNPYTLSYGIPAKERRKIRAEIS